MTRIIDRYIIREVLKTAFGVTGILVLILVGNQLARVLGRAASDRLPKDAVLEFMGLTTLGYLGILIPAAFFISAMLALGRMYRDNEMAALSATGFGMRHLYRPLMLTALPVAALLAWLSFDLLPWAAGEAERVKAEGRRQMQLSALEPGGFRTASQGRLVVHTQGRGEGDEVTGVFIQHREDDVVEVATAARGELRQNGGDNLLVLKDGVRYAGVPGTTGFRIARFREHGVPVPTPELDMGNDPQERAPTRELVDSVNPEYKAELHLRISGPVSIIVLTLLAVPLSRSNPREGRYGRLALGILAYFMYTNLIWVARLAIERGYLPAWLGFWWVHLLMAAVALILVKAHYGSFRVRAAT